MKKSYLIIAAIFMLTGGFAAVSHHGESSQISEEPSIITRENIYVGSVVFSPEPLLVGAEYENDEQIKRIGGLYIVRLTSEFLIVEIYTQGTRALSRKEVYNLSEIRERYPEGVSIWIERDATSAFCILVPWA